MQDALEDVAFDDSIGQYIVEIVAATREHPQLQVGASPRGSLALTLLSRAKAVLAGRDYVIPEDVKTVAPAALTHRVSLKPELWLQQVDPAAVIAEVCARVPAPATNLMPSYTAQQGAVAG
nr:MoxR family ATPase [Stackebrandtia nassauensis]